MLAIDRLLEKHPQYRHKFVFLQIGSPSRTHIKRYHDLIGEIDELVEKVKLMKTDLLEMIQNNQVLFDEIDMTEVEKDENLDHTEEKENLGTIKKYGSTRVNKQ